VSGDPGQVDPSGADFDVEQHVQCLQSEGFHGEEIAGQELLLVVGHQLSPTEGAIAYRSGYDAVPIKDIANSGLGDLVPQLELTTNLPSHPHLKTTSSLPATTGWLFCCRQTERCGRMDERREELLLWPTSKYS
jgi:hypothetical protein